MTIMNEPIVKKKRPARQRTIVTPGSYIGGALKKGNGRHKATGFHEEIDPVPPKKSEDVSPGKSDNPNNIGGILREKDGGGSLKPDASQNASGFALIPKHGGESLNFSEIRVSNSLPACKSLQDLQSLRIVTIRAIIRIENATGALVRRALGFRITMEEKDRAKIVRESAKLISAMKEVAATAGPLAFDLPKTDLIPPERMEITKNLWRFFHASNEALSPYRKYRKSLEVKMEDLAKGLPAAKFIESVKGAGYLGLAIIVGESGDLSNYPNHRHLWKRLGLAPPECYREPTLSGDTALKIPRRRRSAIWTVADSLLKHNDHYQGIYKARRRYEAKQHPEMVRKTKPDGTVQMSMQADRRARRFAEKLFIRDVWLAWNGKTAKEYSGE